MLRLAKRLLPTATRPGGVHPPGGRTAGAAASACAFKSSKSTGFLGECTRQPSAAKGLGVTAFTWWQLLFHGPLARTRACLNAAHVPPTGTGMRRHSAPAVGEGGVRGSGGEGAGGEGRGAVEGGAASDEAAAKKAAALEDISLRERAELLKVRLSDEKEEEIVLEQAVSLRERAAMLKVRLSDEELLLLAQQIGANQDLRLTRKKLVKYTSQKWEREVEREAFLHAIESPAEEKGMLGKVLLPAVGMIGTASFAIAGAQVAGEAGMNIVGCCFVGALSSLGGGAVNALLFGDAKHGVPWVKNPDSLIIALVSSLITFFLWPILCSSLAKVHVYVCVCVCVCTYTYTYTYTYRTDWIKFRLWPNRNQHGGVLRWTA
jgi:hypothetical protein